MAGGSRTTRHVHLSAGVCPRQVSLHLLEEVDDGGCTVAAACATALAGHIADVQGRLQVRRGG